MLTVGNWANQDSNSYNLMRTSDTLPAQFQIFYEVTKRFEVVGHQRKDVAATPNDQLPNKTGLLPDFIWVDEQGTRVADPKTIESSMMEPTRIMLVAFHITLFKVRTQPVKNW